MGDVEKCFNCNGVIGRLEPAHLWKGQVVCQGCHQKLSGQSGGAVAAATAVMPPPAAPVTPRAAEQHLWSGKPSHWYYLRAYIVSAFFFFVAAVAFALVAATGKVVGGVVLAMLPASLAVLPLVVAILRRKHTHYLMTTRMITVKWGVFSRHSHEVPLHGVREVIVLRGFIERLAGVGSVGFSTAASPGVEVWFAGIPEPEAVRQLVNQHTRDA